MSSQIGQISRKELEQRLRVLAARAFEGKAFTPEAVGNICIEAADHLARSWPRYYLDLLGLQREDDSDSCPTCGGTTCHHQHACHCCKACR